MREAMIVNMMVLLILNCNQHLNLKCCSSMPSLPWMPEKLVFPTENGQSWRGWLFPPAQPKPATANFQLFTCNRTPET